MAAGAVADRVVSSAERVELRGGLSIARGTELVGFGSRDPYVLPEAWAELALTVLATRRVGIDLQGMYGASQNDEMGRFEVAAICPLLERDDPRGYSLLVGAGLGGSFGGRFWWEEVRGYPYTLARFTYLPSRETSIYATWTCAPVDTGIVDRLHAFENRFELAGSVGFFSAGARVALTSVSGGDPRRTYGDLEVGFFVALHVTFTPLRSTR